MYVQLHSTQALLVGGRDFSTTSPVMRTTSSHEYVSLALFLSPAWPILAILVGGQAASVIAGAGLTARVHLSISCDGLANLDVGSKSDPFVVRMTTRQHIGEYVLYGQEQGMGETNETDSDSNGFICTVTRINVCKPVLFVLFPRVPTSKCCKLPLAASVVNGSKFTVPTRTREKTIELCTLLHTIPVRVGMYTVSDASGW